MKPWELPWAAWRRADERLDAMEALTRHRLATGQPLCRIVRKVAP